MDTAVLTAEVNSFQTVYLSCIYLNIEFSEVVQCHS